MAVSKEKNGTYKVQYYHTNLEGKRVLTTKRGFVKKRDAEIFDSEMKKRSKTKIDVSGMLLSDFINQYYFPAMQGELKTKTLITKRNVIDEHILNVQNKEIASFKNMKLRDITAEALREWQNAKKKEGYSDGYLLTMRKELSSVLNYAEKQYHWIDNPSKEVPRMGKFNKRVRKDDWWTIDEYETFISAIDKNTIYYVIWNVLFYSGIRLGELLALRKADIDIERNCIYINETYARLKKQDLITSPKTENSERVVYIPQEIMKMVQEYMEKHPDINSNDRVFPIVHRTVEKAFARDIKKSDVRYITVHCLRHSHTAYLISLNTFSMSVISERLGHKDETITSQVYSHVYNKNAMDVAQVMQDNMLVRKSIEESNS